MMKMSKGGEYLKAKDAKRGAVIEVLDEGHWEESKKFTYEDGSPQQQCVFRVRYEGEEKLLKFNKASRVAMIDAFGEESKTWIGKKAKLIIMPTPNGSDKMIVLDPIISAEGKTSDEKAWDDEGK